MAVETKKECVNKTELAKMLAKKHNMTIQTAADQLNEVIDLLTEVLLQKQEINIIGFGHFSVVERKARMGKNPSNGEDIEIPARTAISFKPSKNLKEGVNAKPSKKVSKKKSK